MNTMLLTIFTLSIIQLLSNIHNTAAFTVPSSCVRCRFFTRQTSLHNSNEASAEESIQPLKKNDSGETYFELSPKRRFTVSKWRGDVRLDIREFYEKDGKMLPGTKGLSLTMDQYKIIRDLIQDGTVDDIIQDVEGDD